MKLKKLGLIAICLACLAQAGYLTWAYAHQPPPDGEDQPAEFVCTAKGCGSEFSRTRAEMVAFRRVHPDGGVPCPKCGSALTQRAVHCPTCRKLVPLVGHGQIPGKCPFCNGTISTNASGNIICPGG